ncbi:MAG: 4Fe-4S dicluster domain-containing protein [Candidatus Omnitrophica bacterium]|nr:4Fe-4S dicluster domain-containing protein [Candidatus Omnitrophota bacterium]
MKRLFIAKENLETLIRYLKKTCDEFIAPKEEHLDDIIFGDTKSDNAELTDYEGNSIISPRAFLLPQTEELFKIKSAKDSDLAPITDKKKRIFYGVRPCDIKAIGLMKKFFLDEPVDAFYKQKLANSIFISLACGKRCASGCFCNLMDAGPIARDNFDLQLIPVRRGYLLEAGSKKGEGIVKKNKKLFANAATTDEKEIKGLLNGFRETAKPVDFRKIAGIMQEDKVKQEIWDDIGLRCVVCSGCITLCPTCSCFSITDRLNGDKGIRLRYCDGCPYAGFTRMAGGNTPFPLHKEHIRRFFEHKLDVDVERYGTPSCVGCGRCIQACPGNISIRKFIDSVERIADSV